MNASTENSEKIINLENEVRSLKKEIELIEMSYKGMKDGTAIRISDLEKEIRLLKLNKTILISTIKHCKVTIESLYPVALISQLPREDLDFIRKIIPEDLKVIEGVLKT